MYNLTKIDNFFSSNEAFPVPFDEFWQWCGYSRKSKAKEMLCKNFTQSADYQVLHQMVQNPKGGRPSEIIQLTLDCAKTFAMLAQTEKGKEVRAYFLECEKKYLTLKPKSTLEILELTIQEMKAHSQRLDALDEKVHQIAAKQSSINEDYYTLAGYYSLRRQKWNLSNTQSQQLGRALSLKSKALNYPINKAYDTKYGEVNSYHKDILEQVLNEFS